MDQKIMETEEEKQKTGMVLSSSSQQQTNNNDASSATATSDAAAAREVEVSPKAEATTPAKKDNRKLSKADRPKPEDPELDSGVVDFVCIVGARDIGNQRNDDGSKGWVESTPECCVLERFPPDDEFHVKNGR